MTILQKLPLLFALGLAGLVSPPAALAAPPFQDDEEEAEEAAEEEDDDAPSFLAVVGGDVHIANGGLLRGATVLCKDGKIREVGYDLHVPDDAEVVDASGYQVYPGLVAISSFGLFGGGGDLADTVDPFHRNMTLALAAGITTAVNGSQVGKLKRGSIEGIVIKDDTFESVSFGTNNPSGKRQVREKFAAAAEYLRAYRQWEHDVRSNKDLEEPSKKGVDQDYVDILTGKKRASFSADERNDLVAIARLAQQYDFRPVVVGCREGWTVASELGRAGASAVVTARERRARNERLVREGGSSIENAAILHDHGVPVAVVPQSRGISLGGIVGRDLLHLPTEAAFAVRGGLAEEHAIDAITLVPARLLGLGHRIGSIEAGKDADLIVTDGDLLHYQTWVQWAIVDGEVVYDKQEELFFAHIRPRPDSALAPVDPVDAGEGEDEVLEPPAEDDGEGAGDEEEDGDDDGE